MNKPYVAVRTKRDDFVRHYPEALGTPVGESGFAAFGSAPVRLAQKLRQPDFDEAQVFVVLVDDADVYLALAPHGTAIGYPPEHVKVRITDFGPDVDPESVRQRVRTQGGDVWSGTLISPLLEARRPG